MNAIYLLFSNRVLREFDYSLLHKCDIQQPHVCVAHIGTHVAVNRRSVQRLVLVAIATNDICSPG